MAWYNQPIRPLDPVVESMMPKPPFRYLRDNFAGTGQDSHTLPPTQNQAMWTSLSNVQPIAKGTLDQRWGYAQLTAIINQANRLAIFQSDLLNTRAIIAQGLKGVAAYTEAGGAYVANLFTPEATTGIMRSLCSRNYQYFFDGYGITDAAHRTGDMLKWNGNTTAGVTNWGINVLDTTANNAMGGPSGNMIGPNNPASAANVTGTYNNPWSNVTNVEANDGAPATDSMVAQINPITHQIISLKPTTDQIWATNYFPTANGTSLVGLQATVKHQTTLPNGGHGAAPTVTYYMQLIKGGALYGAIKTFTVSASTGGYSTFTLGGASDLWGGTVTLSDIIASNFGVALWATWNLGGVDSNGNGTATSFVDWIGLTAFVTGGTGGSGTSGAGVGIEAINTSGSVTLTLGRIYYLVGFNSLTGHFTDLSVASASTGPQTNAEFTLLLATFNDPQVDTKYLLATADGGDPSILYEVPVLQGSTVTAWSITTNVLTVTVPNTFVAGQQVTLGGFVHGNYLNGQTVTVLASGLSGSQFKANFTHGNDSATEFGIVGSVSTAIPNTVTQVVDDTPDTTLVFQQPLVFTDQFGNEFGLALNTPPSITCPGTLCIKHQGRLWMAGVPNSTHSVFFSKSVGELTLPNGFIAGKYEEAWPGNNYFDVSDGAESVSGLLSDGTTLYIGTQNHIRRLIGNAPSNFQLPQIVHPNTGLINQEVWQLVFQQGAPSGCIWLTPDFRVIQSDFNTYADIGSPIQDILNNLQLTANTLAHATYAVDGEYEVYILSVPFTQSTFCDTHLVFDMRQRMWSVWTPASGSQSLMFNINASGVPQWLFIDGASANIFQYMQTATTDNGVAIPVTAITSFLHLGEPTRRKILNELDIYGNLNMSVSIFGANSTADFNSPATLLYNQPPISSPFGTPKVYMTGTQSRHKYYQFKFFANNGSPTFLNSFAVQGSPLDDI